MHVLLVSGDSSRMGVLRDGLRCAVSPSLGVIHAQSCWEALQALSRTDISWALVVVVSPIIRLVTIDQVCDPMQEDIADFIESWSTHASEGGIHLLTHARTLGVVPQYGIVCGYDGFLSEKMASRIADAGGIPIKDDELFKECVRRVRSVR